MTNDDYDTWVAEVMKKDKELSEAYACADDSPGERYDKDLIALVNAARQVAEDFDLRHLREAVEQFEPWLEQDEDPRSMGWVDDKGRP